MMSGFGLARLKGEGEPTGFDPGAPRDGTPEPENYEPAYQGETLIERLESVCRDVEESTDIHSGSGFPSGEAFGLYYEICGETAAELHGLIREAIKALKEAADGSA